MDRGYIKLWRKAQESASWNRGLMYQGLIVNLLMRACWKESSYQGHTLKPGQFGAVLSHMAEALNIPRSTVVRMMKHLQADGFLTVLNVDNRFCIITITNWQTYQQQKEGAWSTNGQPTVDQRLTNGQPSLREEESKKERILNTTPLPPTSGGSGDAVSNPRTARSQVSKTESAAQIEAYTESPELRESLKAFVESRRALRKPLTAHALGLAFSQLDKLASDDATKIAVVDQSVLNGWQGFFELKTNNARASPPVQHKSWAEMEEERCRAEYLRLTRNVANG